MNMLRKPAKHCTACLPGALWEGPASGRGVSPEAFRGAAVASSHPVVATAVPLRAGFKVFLEQDVDVVILEVGLGGRLDATNCVRAPLVCGVSSLGCAPPACRLAP